MVSYENFNLGADYGLDPNRSLSGYGAFTGYQIPAGSIGMATDVRTANQLQEVGNKLNTGAKTVEVSGIQTEILESIPKDHFKELHRQAKLAGADLTFHGPIIEATGITNQGWDESKRLQAERQMFSAVERGQALNPEGNTVTTFHTAAGLPEMVSKSKVKGKEKIDELWIVNEEDGKFASVKAKPNPLTGIKEDPYEELKRLNNENWFKQLSGASFHVTSGQHSIDRVTDNLISNTAKIKGDDKMDYADIEKIKKEYMQFYKDSKTEKGLDFLKSKSPGEQRIIRDFVNEINHGELFVRDAYNDLQNLFRQAWAVAEKNPDKMDLNKLKKLRNEIQGKLNYAGDPAKLSEFADAVSNGINMLNTFENAPETFKPMNEFAIDKASDTFSNVAFRAFKKFGDKAPIISLENPPAGGGLSRAEDMRELIDETRIKFIERATEELGISRSQAEKQAEKLVGATWDVGHINMLKKFGYDDKDIIKQAEEIAPYVKHVHLSDNFGFDHTELPMGMGDVPTKEHMEAIQKYGKKVKKIIEAGNWYQHFKTPPVSETFEAFGSPVYAAPSAPTWTEQSGMMGDYFSGIGAINPEMHHSIYGAGFSGLPPELGGQMNNTGQSRFSGTAMD